MKDKKPGKKNSGLLQRGWRGVREAGPLQLVVTCLLVAIAILFARFSWVLPLAAAGTDPADQCR